ncbi:MAG: hypothetical protein LW814_19475 [Anabaena sp. CoA2_C59]|jgi:hypothetical protein|nr:hypothetical protein [Anabaena sp. CoA2_C59]MDJ0507233.1 hypothetical protein [Nostocales cyanobacterium LE14-WE12]
MPTYLYFGENEFFLNGIIKQLKTHILDQQWANFNYTEYPPESKETIPQALSEYHDTTSWEWRKISTPTAHYWEFVQKKSCCSWSPFSPKFLQQIPGFSVVTS